MHLAGHNFLSFQTEMNSSSLICVIPLGHSLVELRTKEKVRHDFLAGLVKKHELHLYSED
jgi:hypothetical protein